MFAKVTIVIFLAGQVNGQYGELGSLIGGVLAPNAIGNAASGASGLLGNIGTLYQIAQGALQLTGTGVGILNQASEGKWFNTVVEEARNANREIQDRALTGNRLEPDYSQFGINFPAPAPSDYDNEEDTKLDGLIPISANSITSEIAVPTESSSVTLFPIPEENETRNVREGGEENRNSVSTTDVSVTEVTEELTNHSGKENPKIKESNDCNHKEKQMDKRLKLAEEKIPKLQRFIALLHESNITENDLVELTQLLERKKVVKFKSTDSRIFFTSPAATLTTASTFQHINEINESLITSPPIIFRRIGPTDITDNEDNDLLPSTTTPLSKARAVRIKYQSRNRTTILRRPTSYPRRVAYRARLPFLSNTTRANVTKSKQSEVDTRGRVIPQIRLAEQKLDGLTQLFMQRSVQNPFKQSETFPTVPIFGIFQATTLPPSIYPQATNAFQFQPNNGLWPYQQPVHILGQPNLHSNSNFG